MYLEIALFLSFESDFPDWQTITQAIMIIVKATPIYILYCEKFFINLDSRKSWKSEDAEGEDSSVFFSVICWGCFFSLTLSSVIWSSGAFELNKDFI